MATAQSHLSRFRTRRRHCHLTIPLLTWPNFQSYTSVFHRFLKSTVSILNKVLLYVDVARFRKQSSYSLSASLLPHDLRNPSLLSNLSLPPLPFFLSASHHFVSYNLTSPVAYDKLVRSLVQRGQIPKASFAPWKAGPLDMVAGGACPVTVLILLLHILVHSSLIQLLPVCCMYTWL